MLKKRKFLIGGLVVAMAMGYLGYMGFSSAATYYYTVGELGQLGSSIYGKNVRVNGVVATDSLKREAQGTVLKFNITDAGGGMSLPVVFRGVAPDTFKAGADIVAEGYLTPEGVFQSTTILAKCPSRYEAQETG
ncbi:MAG: cytochrome c maturation protein CcmE [Dehalococcoidales bacterium]|nr:cytochrome c maturation protein CcmE [Dehalococcoidales bacterium]